MRGVSFRAGEGFTSIMGPNGSGKTTVLSMVAGALKPSRGSIRVCGLDVWGEESEAVRARRLIGFAPQDMPFKERLTGFENLVIMGMLRGMGFLESRREARRVLELVGLAEHGDRRVVTYSGGMRRRLAIASSIIHEPEVLVLDEPSSGLDPVAREEIWSLIERVGAGRVVVYSTHISQEAEAHSGNVLIFHGGRVVAEGAPVELIRRYAPKPRVIVVHEPLSELPVIDGLRGQAIDETTSVYEVEDASAWLPRVIEGFISLGVQVERVEVRRPGLEEVYFRVTGSRLEV